MASVGNVYLQNVSPYRLPLSATVLLDPKAEEPEPEKMPEEGNPTGDHRSKAAPTQSPENLDIAPLRRMPDESWEDYVNRIQRQRPWKCIKKKDGKCKYKVPGQGPDGGANCPLSSNGKRRARNARKKKRKEERQDEDIRRWLQDPGAARTIQKQRKSLQKKQNRIHKRRMKILVRRSCTPAQKRWRRWWPQEDD